MSPAVMSGPRPTVRSRGTRVRQLADHSALYAPWRSLPGASVRTRRDIPDAIMVPATRPASAIEPLIDLAADVGAELVVVCSGQTSVDQVAERMERRIGARGVAASIAGCPTVAGKRTAGEQFAGPNGARSSDLSAKRNLGLLLARVRGWSKIVFVDDDISITTADVTRIGRQLDRYPIVGMRCRDYPDNSVLCHARRRAKLQQDVFVTGAVLGVHCDVADLDFFPDVYNEDWFFFGDAAAARRLPKPLAATQAPYDPFARPERARHEEFGDLLAEGLYALIESSGLPSFDLVVDHAREAFWESFIVERLDTIDTVHKTLTSFDDLRCGLGEADDAVVALKAARAAYDTPEAAITPATCIEFLDGWRDDTTAWHSTLARPATSATTEEALTALGVADLRSVRPLIRT